MAVKVAINGFGRIGRLVFRAGFKSKKFDIVAINDLPVPAETLAHLLKYDSTFGELDADISVNGSALSVNGKEIKVLSCKNPEELPWKDMGVDILVESTGIFSDREGSSKHIKAGAKKVIITAPAKGEDITIVLGVNHEKYKSKEHNIISNASCTTNCVAPIARVLHDTFGIKHGLMTTIHSYTNDQKILDLPHKDLRRARAAALSMIPTTTGAAKATALVIPELKGKLDGFAMRVPTPNVSVVDLVVEVDKKAAKDSVNDALKKAADGKMKGILRYVDIPLVSKDFNGDSHSSIVDAALTMVIEDTLVKVISWYDNEWGYSSRVVDLIEYIISQGL
ncbi:MAG: type I glyceraldehyde-3-phosphate dehydrogenase [Candidatus Omnitrophica bacterium]|nr:type I glyceraldehyde-3-phosphate dehydrogenase [Candidatus Omnitrophota bacterium]